MNEVLKRCLEDLEARIDEEHEAEQVRLWEAFLTDRWNEPFFRPPARKPEPPRVDWPTVNINDAVGDVDLMLLSQFAGCSGELNGGRNRLCVRCNYGTGILPAAFGCELFSMPRETNTLPTVRPLGSPDRIRAALDAGEPDLSGGLVGRVFEAAERFLGVFKAYPRIGRCVALYHPDVQGPIDAVELLWGSELFYAFYDEPDLLRDVLDLMTRTYAAFMRKWEALVPPENGVSTHWGMMHAGRLMIRNDSLMNLSPELYVEFVRPLDARLFAEFGGGAIHFCGRGDHYIEPMSETPGLTAVHMSQPELNDLETILRHTVDRGIKLLDLPGSVIDGLAGRPLHGQVHTRRA